MRCTRRHLLCASSAGLLLPLAGCTGDTDIFFWDTSISVSVHNDTNRGHSFSVTISRGNVVLYTEPFIVEAVGFKIDPEGFEVPEYGETYEVAVAVDADPVHRGPLTIEEGDDGIGIFFDGDEVTVTSRGAA